MRLQGSLAWSRTNPRGPQGHRPRSGHSAAGRRYQADPRCGRSGFRRDPVAASGPIPHQGRATDLVDVARGRLLDIVWDRIADEPARRLMRRPHAWLEQIRWAVPGPIGPRSAPRCPTPATSRTRSTSCGWATPPSTRSNPESRTRPPGTAAANTTPSTRPASCSCRRLRTSQTPDASDCGACSTPSLHATNTRSAESRKYGPGRLVLLVDRAARQSAPADDLFHQPRARQRVREWLSRATRRAGHASRGPGYAGALARRRADPRARDPPTTRQGRPAGG